MADNQDEIPDFDQPNSDDANENSDSEKDCSNVKDESIDKAEYLNLNDDNQAKVPLNLNVNVNCGHCDQSFGVIEIEDHQNQCFKNNKKSTRKSRSGRPPVSQIPLKKCNLGKTLYICL